MSEIRIVIQADIETAGAVLGVLEQMAGDETVDVSGIQQVSVAAVDTTTNERVEEDRDRSVLSPTINIPNKIVDLRGADE